MREVKATKNDDLFNLLYRVMNMIDPRLLRQELTLVADRLKTRGFMLNTERFVALEHDRKHWHHRAESAQQQRNTLSKQIGILRASQQDTTELQEQVVTLKTELETAEYQLAQIEQQLEALSLELPNIPAAHVPMGESEDQNVIVKTVGEIKRSTGIDHIDLLEPYKLILNEQAAQLSGSRFSILKGPVARLHRALTQYMLDYHAQAGYIEYYVPYLVQASALVGTGQLPKFEADLFCLKGERSLYLIPTAEVPLTNLVADTILQTDELPLKMMAHTPCFRSEAGSYGKDTKGLFRQHQFEKIELVHIATPQQSHVELESMVEHVSGLLSSLELPHRIMQLCTGDMGFASAQTFDLEVWLPGQARYREISSCSNFHEFQARRLKARHRKQQKDKTEFVHTLNGSGVAVGRALIAVIENHGTSEGCAIPQALRPFLGGFDFVSWQ